MRSWIRIDLDEDQELLKCVTLGPAIKEYVEALSSSEMAHFIFDFQDMLLKIWINNTNVDFKDGD